MRRQQPLVSFPLHLQFGLTLVSLFDDALASHNIFGESNVYFKPLVI